MINLDLSDKYIVSLESGTIKESNIQLDSEGYFLINVSKSEKNIFINYIYKKNYGYLYYKSKFSDMIIDKIFHNQNCFLSISPRHALYLGQEFVEKQSGHLFLIRYIYKINKLYRAYNSVG